VNKNLFFRDTSVILIGYENLDRRALSGSAGLIYRGWAMHVAALHTDTFLSLERRWFKSAS